MNKLLILTSFYVLKSSLRFRTIFFLLSLSLSIHGSKRKMTQPVFCLINHHTMNKIGHDTDERKVQEFTKLSVKAWINEEKKVRSGQTIV